MAQWFRVRTENARGTRKTMIVALARKLLIALWRLVQEGWCRTASFCVPHNDQEDVEGTQQFWPSLSTRGGSPMTVRGGGDPVELHGLSRRNRDPSSTVRFTK